MAGKILHIIIQADYIFFETGDMFKQGNAFCKTSDRNLFANFLTEFTTSFFTVALR